MLAADLGGAVVPLVRAVVPLLELSGSTAWIGRYRRWFREIHRTAQGEIGAEKDDFGAKLDGLWMESGETWEDARSTRKQANPWININKTSSNQQITKILGLFLVGIFGFRTKTTKSS